MNPWQETWTYVIDKWETYLEFVWNRDVYDKAMTPERAQLASAAPEMCRALLAVEKRLQEFVDDDSAPGCLAELFLVCAALTKAGLPDQASRDAARKELGI